MVGLAGRGPELPPTYVFQCESGDGDYGEVGVAHRRDTNRNVVALLTTSPKAGVQVLLGLTSGAARVLAAEILNRADQIDGETPLTFYPPGPSAAFPPGHPDAS